MNRVLRDNLSEFIDNNHVVSMVVRHPCHDNCAPRSTPRSRSKRWNPLSRDGPQAEQEHTLPARGFGSPSLSWTHLSTSLTKTASAYLRFRRAATAACTLALLGLCRHHPSLTLPSSSSLLDLSSPSLLPPCVLHSLLAYFQSPYLLTHHRNRQDSCHCLRRHPTFPYGLRSALFLNKPCS